MKLTRAGAASLCLVLCAAAIQGRPAVARAATFIPLVKNLATDSRGRALLAVGGDPGIRVVRLRRGGVPDRSFAEHGVLRPQQPMGGAAMAVYGNSVLLAGRTGKRLVVRRYRANGWPDRTFGRRGALRLPASRLKGLFFQPSGRIVLLVLAHCPAARCGYTYDTLLFVRLSARGRVLQVHEEHEEDWGLTGAAMGPDGRLVVGGIDFNLGRDTLIRFRPGGRPDRSLGGRLGLSEELPGDPVWVPAVAAIQPDGKILLARAGNGALLRRRSREGLFDAGFGMGGTVECDPRSTPPAPDFADVAPMPDLRLVAAGGSGDCQLVRYLPNGVPDPSFGVDGAVDAGADGMPRVEQVAPDGAGGVYVAGWDGASEKFRVAHYDLNGGFAADFGEGAAVALAPPP